MNNLNYTIHKANKVQREYVLERVTIKNESERENAIIFVATNQDNDVIGRIVLLEQVLPLINGGKIWYISNVFVHQGYRRNGIATQLLNYTFTEANKLGIWSLQGSANATQEAHGFWSVNGFVFIKYGKPHNDPLKPLEVGNYSHFIFRRVNRICDICSFAKTTLPITISEADSKYREEIVEKAFSTNCLSHINNRKNECNVLIASNFCGDTVGYVIFYDETMSPPLNGKSRFLAYCYTDENYRNRGIAKKMLNKLFEEAKKESIDQIIGVYTNEKDIPFFLKLGFDILITRYIMSATPSGQYSIGIGKRIENTQIVLSFQNLSEGITSRDFSYKKSKNEQKIGYSATF